MQFLKNMLLIYIVCLIRLSLTQEIDQEYDYNKYMVQFQRKYQGEQKIGHENIFVYNLQKIRKLQKQGFDVEVNNFTDWNQSQLQRIMNYRPQQFNITRSPKPLKASLSASLPAPTEFDWRARDRVTSVKNQGNCGSCWAFAATALFQSQLAMQQSGKKYDLSEQYVLQCAPKTGGCNGGAPYYGLQLLKNTGAPLQQTYPYTESSSSYPTSTLCSSPTTTLQSQIYSIYHAYNITIDQLQNQLISQGPIVVGVDAYNTMFPATGIKGLVSCTGSVRINHAVLLVGYNSTHWFIKNSWGESWGDHGFGYIEKGNDCLLRQEVDIVYVRGSGNQGSDMVDVFVNMTDKFGNGWSGNIVAVRQNGVIVGTFGENFTSGFSRLPLKITIPANIQTQVVLYQLGTYSEQMGFTITSSYQQNIYTLTPGYRIPNNTIFVTFCPNPKLCSLSPDVTYYLNLFDSYGDGWNGNVLGFRANGVVLKNFTMASGRSLGPISVVFDKYVKVQIVVVVIGSYTDQVGFELRNKDGYLVANRPFKYRFYSTSILATFYPQSINLSPVQASPELIKQQLANQQSLNNNEESSVIAYKISTFVLSALCIIFTIITIILGLKILQLKRLSMSVKSKVGQSVDFGNNVKVIQLLDANKNIIAMQSCQSIHQVNLDLNQIQQKSKKVEDIKSQSSGSSKNIV